MHVDTQIHVYVCTVLQNLVVLLFPVPDLNLVCLRLKIIYSDYFSGGASQTSSSHTVKPSYILFATLYE